MYLLWGLGILSMAHCYIRNYIYIDMDYGVYRIGYAVWAYTGRGQLLISDDDTHMRILLNIESVSCIFRHNTTPPSKQSRHFNSHVLFTLNLFLLFFYLYWTRSHELVRNNYTECRLLGSGKFEKRVLANIKIDNLINSPISLLYLVSSFPPPKIIEIRLYNKIISRLGYLMRTCRGLVI